MLQLYRVTVDPVEQVDLLVILVLGFLDQRLRFKDLFHSFISTVPGEPPA